MTTLGPRHSLASCLVTGTYKNYYDEELVKQIDEICLNSIEQGEKLREWATTSPVLELFGDTQRERNVKASKFASFCIRSDIKAYMCYLEQNIFESWNIKYGVRNTFDYQGNRGGKILFVMNDLWDLHIGTGFWIMLMALVVSVTKWVKEKKCPWNWLGVAGTLLIIYIFVYIGSYADLGA